MKNWVSFILKCVKGITSCVVAPALMVTQGNAEQSTCWCLKWDTWPFLSPHWSTKSFTPCGRWPLLAEPGAAQDFFLLKKSFSFPLLPSACWLVGVIVGLYLTVWSTLLWFGAKWMNLILNWCHRKCPFCSEWKLMFRPLLCIIDQFKSWKVLIDAVLQAFQSEVTENGMIGRRMVCCRKSWEAPPPLQTSQMKRASPHPILFLFCVNLKRCAVSSVPSPCFCGRLFWTDITGDDIIRKQEFCCVQTHVSCLIWLPQLWSMSVGLCIREPRKCAPLPVCAENATGIMRGVQTSSSGKNSNRKGSENSGFP